VTILLNQARSFVEKREYKKAENCFIQAKKPELAVKMYKDVQNFQEAFRVAKKEAPHLVPELQS
jgi:intraflagellar transport protein 172